MTRSLTDAFAQNNNFNGHVMSKIQFEFLKKVYELDLKKVGEEHCLPQKKRERRKKDYHSLHFVLFGYGILCVNGKEIPLNRGSVFMLYAGEEYEYFPDSIDPWAYCWIDFCGGGVGNLEELFSFCGFTREKPYLRINEYSKVVEIFKNLIQSYDSSITQSMACSAQLLLLLSYFIGCKNKYAQIGKRNSARFKLFRDILIYINNNYRMNLSLRQIADDMYISEKQLITMFRDYAGMTPVNYINKFRISNACTLLQETDEKIAKIAEMVGIEDEKYFTRMFVKWVGENPREWRKKDNKSDFFAWLGEKELDFR